MATFSTPQNHADIVIRVWDDNNATWLIDHDTFVPANIVSQARRYEKFGLVPTIWHEWDGGFELRMMSAHGYWAWAFVKYDHEGSRIGSYWCGPYINESMTHDSLTRRLRETTREYGMHPVA